jgi:hypothetical protein
MTNAPAPAPPATLSIILPLAAPASAAAAPAATTADIIVVTQATCPEGVGALVELNQHCGLVSKLGGKVLDLQQQANKGCYGGNQECMAAICQPTRAELT